MLADITRLDLRLRRRSAIGYAAGMALYTLIVVASYPSFKDQTSLNSLSGSTAAALFGVTGKLTSSCGWLNGDIYANFFPLIMLLMTIGYGAAALAGQDEDGALAPSRSCRSGGEPFCSRRSGRWPSRPSSWPSQ